jgi:anti-sigma B factor antagonist
MDISVRKRGAVQLVHLRGDLRLGAPVDEFRQVMEEFLNAGDTKVVLEMAEVRILDSSGIGALVKYLKSTRERGGALKLVKPTDFAIKTLRVVGVLNLFEVFDEAAAAVASFDSASMQSSKNAVP